MADFVQLPTEPAPDAQGASGADCLHQATNPAMDQLRVTEIFFSLQGETRTVGLPTVFIRLTGCPLRCVYCDTTYAFHGGARRSLEDILRDVAQYRPRYVTLTGGEPLAQRNSLALLRALADQGYEVSLETSGAQDVSEVDPRIVKVMDLKTPSSGEAGRNRYENLAWLDRKDQVKFVIADEPDYRWSVAKLDEWRIPERCEALFSPVAGVMAPTVLAEWILRDRLPVRLQLQLHKLLWGNMPGK